MTVWRNETEDVTGDGPYGTENKDGPGEEEWKVLDEVSGDEDPLEGVRKVDLLKYGIRP